jgi:hypothetical protein
MYQSAETVITIDSITIAARTIVTAATQMLLLLKQTVSQEQEEGDLRN